MTQAQWDKVLTRVRALTKDDPTDAAMLLAIRDLCNPADETQLDADNAAQVVTDTAAEIAVLQARLAVLQA